MAVLDSTITIQHLEPRPCWAKGRRAVFHRWTDTARAIVPHGLPEIETEVRFQLWTVHGLVEYEDGTLERVWPQDIQFPEHSIFRDYDWDAMERERDRLELNLDINKLHAAVETLRTAEEPNPKPGGLLGWFNNFKRAAAEHEEIMADAESERG